MINQNNISRIAAFLLATMVMTAPSMVFAARGGTTGGTAADPTQAKSSATGTVYIAKDLMVSQPGKFPSVSDFNFTVENIGAWDNANVSVSGNGADISASAMPQPAAKTSSHNSVTISDSTHALVTTGDFTGEADTDITDTSTEKYRSTPVEITFTKAGWYMYKISENRAETANIPGMQYDDKSYYAVFYVCNKTDASGNTVNGVYVHDITLYRNSPSTDYKPDTSDISNTPDHGGVAAAGASYENLDKIAISSPYDGPVTDPVTGEATGPNKLTGAVFYNDQTTHDVVITNNVTGNLGDITKEFEYKLTLTGLEKNKTYTTSVAAQDKPAGTGINSNTTSEGAVIAAIPETGKGTIDSATKSFTSNANGEATFMLKLADDEVVVLNALPSGSKYKVEELANDHIASFTSDSTERDSWVMSLVSKANTHNMTALATAEETADAISNVTGRQNTDDNDGTVTINFKNHRDIVTNTGLPYYGDYQYVLMMIVLAALAALVIRKHGLRKKD